MPAIDRADPLNIDPHNRLLQPHEAGCIVAKWPNASPLEQRRMYDRSIGAARPGPGSEAIHSVPDP